MFWLATALSTVTVSEFDTEAPQATVSEGFAQVPYVAARAGVEPMTLRTKGVDATNAPHAPQNYDYVGSGASSTCIV